MAAKTQSSKQKAARPAIECSKNGPYLVKNLGTFVNSYGEEIPARRPMALCRWRSQGPALKSLLAV